MWAEAYAFVVYYTMELAGVRPNGQQINPRRKAEVSIALDLLRWAALELADPADRPWPVGRPSPQTEPNSDEILQSTQDLALMAVAFILHHELAHIRLKHSGPTDVEQERDADYAAFDWISEEVTPGSPEFQKRCLGTVVALLYLVTSGVYTGAHGGTTHPKDYNRLLFTLERRVPPNIDGIWGFVDGMLDLLIQDAGSVPPRGPFQDFHEACSALANHLAALEAQE